MQADPLEPRRIYTCRSDKGDTITAERIDALLPHTKREPDLECIASQWRYVNSFSTRTIFRGIERAPAKPLPSGSLDATSTMLSSLKKYGGKNVVVALSGGFDSRTLMALLHGAGVPFSVLTYGMDGMPDVETARAVAAADGVDCNYIDVRRIGVDAALVAMKETAIISEGTYSAAHGAVLPTIAQSLAVVNGLLIDGAYGSLLRGGFGNRALLQGWKDLSSGSAARIDKWFAVSDFALFHADIRKQMMDGAVQTLQEALDSMSQFSIVRGREWMDAFFVRWNAPGFVSNPQRIYDRWFENEMPYLQPDVVASVFRLNARQRSNGKLFRNWMKEYRPSLTSIPFVGKHSYYKWSDAGRPLRIALREKWRTKHSTSASMEIGIFKALKAPLSDMAKELADEQLIFDKAAVRELVADVVDKDDKSRLPEFFKWLTLGIALRA